MNDNESNTGIVLAADLELERLVAELPHRRPSDHLDRRVAATAHFESRPMISRMRWPAAAAAIFFVAAGLAIGWSLRSAAGRDWVPVGTEWKTAGFTDFGARELPSGDVVRSAGTLYIRTEKFRDPVRGATIEINSLEPRLMVGRPCAD
ncbi:MAG: hypothetical protein K8R92_03515 [Planctomycetes bacterium]|nr:hypothetical protein [Planctomycetota bacterium]